MAVIPDCISCPEDQPRDFSKNSVRQTSTIWQWLQTLATTDFHITPRSYIKSPYMYIVYSKSVIGPRGAGREATMNVP